MKNEQQKTKERQMILPTVKMASDFFVCRNCGYTVRMLVRGNIAHCSQCGGTMDRK